MNRNQLSLLWIAFAAATLAFCVFGFMATFEPGKPAVAWSWRAGYSLVGMTTIWVSVRLALQPRRPR